MLFPFKSKFLWVLVSLLFTAGISEDTRKESRKFTTSSDDTQIQEGESSYTLIVRNSRMPRYGTCWKEALNKLENGCKQLTDEVQSRLSLQFANCFLASAGEKTYPCDEGTPLSECLHQMEMKGFNSYVNFFGQTRSMCQFLQMVVWQEETENTVNKLADNTVKVIQTLENSNELQNSILDKQIHSLSQQEKLLESSSLLGQALDMSENKVKNMLEEFRTSTTEQKHMIFEMFDRVSKLQNVVLGEVSGFYSLIFYPTALLTVYLLTSTTRTSAARFWLFIIFCCSLVVERMVMWMTLDSDTGYLPADEASIEIFWRIWLIRKVAMLGCVIILFYYAYTFQDFNVINNAILVQIQRQNQEMKHYLEMIGAHRTDNLKLLKTDTLPNHFRSIDVSDLPGTQTDCSDSEFSYDSEASDDTYIPNKESSDGEDTFETAPSRPSSNVTSPEKSPVLTQIQKGTKIKSLMRSTTPSPYSLRSRESLARSFHSSGIFASVNESQEESPVQKRVAQIQKGTKKKPSIASTTPSPYSLRSRSSLTRPFHSSVMSGPANESPETFGRIVQKMERISKKNASKIIETLQNSIHTASYYSSDDE